jgi:hypothetical protein
MERIAGNWENVLVVTRHVHQKDKTEWRPAPNTPALLQTLSPTYQGVALCCDIAVYLHISPQSGVSDKTLPLTE